MSRGQYEGRFLTTQNCGRPARPYSPAGEHVRLFRTSLVVPSKLGDMVILSDIILDLKPEAIRNVKAETAIVRSKAVLRRVRISR